MANNSKTCSLENCNNAVVARELCRKHYQRWWQHGDVNYNFYEADTRFEENVNRTETCWLWMGWKDEDGYGRFNVDGKHIYVHRYAFYKKHGRYPEPMGLHTCDNPSCVNPDHIYEGDHPQNMKDRSDRNRQWHPKGELHGASKLTEVQAREIKYSKESITALVARFPISRSTVSYIRNGKKWAHI